MGYSLASREQVPDFMAEYPGLGEMRWYTEALACDRVSFSWRTMPANTGGRGSYGHRHPGLEEVYLVLSGTATFKVDDEVFEAGPQTAVRVDADCFHSVHNDGDLAVELIAISARSDGATEKQDGFWPR